MGISRHAPAAALTGLLASVAALPAAQAEVVDSGTLTDSFSFVDNKFCGVSGLKVRLEGTLQLRWTATTHGPDGYVFYVQEGARTSTLTNVRHPELFVVETVRTLERDQTITVNRDGTLTIEVLATGSARVTDAAGNLIAADPGQLRFELLVDDNGTPDDASDDTVEFLGVTRPSTGRSDDFCENVVPALTPGG
jgi:hypothetical protein